MLTRTKDNATTNVLLDARAKNTKSTASLVVRGFIQIVLMIVVLAGSLLFMNRLIDAKPEVRKQPKFRTIYTVQTLPVKITDHQPNFTVYGEATASRSVDLRSFVTGEVIRVSTKLKAGTRVNKGEALVEIDAFNFEGALREAQANRDEVLARIQENKSRINMENSKLRHLNNQLELARNDHQRISQLRAKGTTTQKQLDDRSMALSQRSQAAEQTQISLQTENAKLQQQMAGLARLNWRVQLAERNLKNTTLKAPFDGIVRTTGAEVGKIITANDIIVSIYEDANIDIKFTLTDERYGRLQSGKDGLIGRDIKINWSIGGQKYTYPAKIDRVGAEISSNRGGVEVFANLQSVPGNPAIRPGAFVEIMVPDTLFANSAKIPETAVYDGNRVYIKIDDKLSSRRVRILAYNNGEVILSGELQNNDRVLVTRIAEISDGIRVREEASGSDKTTPKK